jgi:hypothetical protein
MSNYYFPEIENLVGRPYGKSTRYILIAVLVIVVVIGIIYFLIATGYINSKSPSSIDNPNNTTANNPRSGAPINVNTGNTQTNTNTTTGGANTNAGNVNSNGNVIY